MVCFSKEKIRRNGRDKNKAEWKAPKLYRNVIKPYIPKVAFPPKSKNVYDLSIGVPDPYNPLEDKTIKSIEKSYNFLGNEETKKVITEFLQIWGLKINTERIIITPGSTGAYRLITTLINPNIGVDLKTPYFSIHKSVLEEKNITITKNGDVEVITTPNNPSGELITSKTNKPKIIDLTYLPLIPYYKNDREIKAFLNWLKEQKDQALLFSLSKLFYPGLRIGWLIIPSEWLNTITPMDIIGSIVMDDSGLSTHSETLAYNMIKELLNDEKKLRNRIESINNRIAAATNMFKEHGMEKYISKPIGAYYVLFDICLYLKEKTKKLVDEENIYTFVQNNILNKEEATVYVIDGSIFGVEGKIRLSLGKENSIEGVKKFIELLEKVE